MMVLDEVTTRKLEIFHQMLLRWQKTINLVSSSTLSEAWDRHFVDSMQVSGLAPHLRVWADLGSGAGFPGLVTAICLAGVEGAVVHLIESDQRKCAFLREVSRETQAPTVVHNGRIEHVLPTLGDDIQGISARALAPLATLIRYSAQHLLKGAIGIFHKGQDVVNELTEHPIDSRFQLEFVPSMTNIDANIVLVRAKAALTASR